MLFRRLITPFAVTACILSLAACASRGDNSQDRGLLGGVFGGGGQVNAVDRCAKGAGHGLDGKVPIGGVDHASTVCRRQSWRGAKPRGSDDAGARTLCLFHRTGTRSSSPGLWR